MATPSPSLSSHYRTQAGLALLLSRLVQQLWQSLRPGEPDSVVQVRDGVAALIHQFSLASATLARREYAAQRLTAGVRAPFTVPLADPPSPEQVDRSLGWAMHDLADTATLTKVEGAAQRLVLDTGRETVVDAVKADPRARAWAREARPDCCSFCAMLATRGAVYESSESAGDATNRYHDHCHCQVVPVFGAYEPPAHVRQWQADWQRVTAGKGGDAALLAWRQFIEGRVPKSTDQPHQA